jgi:hypothetical protein
MANAREGKKIIHKPWASGASFYHPVIFILFGMIIKHIIITLQPASLSKEYG